MSALLMRVTTFSALIMIVLHLSTNYDVALANNCDPSLYRDQVSSDKDFRQAYYYAKNATQQEFEEAKISVVLDKTEQANITIHDIPKSFQPKLNYSLLKASHHKNEMTSYSKEKKKLLKETQNIEK